MTIIHGVKPCRRIFYARAAAYSVCSGLAALMLLMVSFGHAQDEAATLEEYRPVFDLDSFAGDAPGTVPEGWEIVAANAWPARREPVSSESWSLAEGVVPGGGAALCINTLEPVAVLSPQIHLSDDLRSLSGSITATGGDEGQATLYWMAEGAVLEAVVLQPASGPEGRCRFNLSESERPVAAESVRVSLVTHGKTGEAFCWQTVRFMGLYAFVPEVTLMCNRLGYEQVAPKQFTIRSNFPAHTARFSITDEFGEVVYEEDLGEGGQVKSAGDVTWEDFYFQGDFTNFEEEGDYTLTVKMDDCPEVTGSIRIRFDVLWEEAFLPAVTPFQHCRPAPGAAPGPLRLWDDPGLNKASDAVLLWSLVQSWSLLQGRYSGDPRLLPLEQEALYGADALTAWVLQGNAVHLLQHEEFPLYLNALTCIARYKKDADKIKEAARLLIRSVLDEKRKGMWFFFAAMDLYEATGEGSYLAYAKEIYPGIVLQRVESLLEYEYVTDTPISVYLREAFCAGADILLANAANPFGLTRSQEDSGKGFFTWNEGVKHPLLGNTARLLSAVQTACQAYRYSAEKQYLVLAYHQLNWLLGNNPFGVCLISGLCREHEPPVRYPEGFRSDDAGALVLHGTGPQAPEVDLPRFTSPSDGSPDENTNGFSLYNNAQYIKALAFLKRIPVARPK